MRENSAIQDFITHKPDKVASTMPPGKNESKIRKKNAKKFGKKAKKILQKNEGPKPVEQKQSLEHFRSSDSVSSEESDSGLSIRERLEKVGFNVANLGGQKPSRVSKPPTLSVGDSVSCLFQKGNEWFPGKVTKVHRDKTYSIQYDDGEVETRVELCFIKTRASATMQNDVDMIESDGVTEFEASHTVVSDADGWEVVSKKMRQKDPGAPKIDYETGEVMLTKKQRESRRRREKQREEKEVARQMVQEKGLHVRWGGNLQKWKET